MSEEKWLKDINDIIDFHADCDIEVMKKVAEENDIDVNYVLEKYKDKIAYKINKMVK